MRAQTTTDDFDAFLSYHSGDAEWVVALKAGLESKGVRVWLDRDQIRPGDRFVTILEQALASVRSVIVVVSPGSLRSKWVEDEYHRALALTNLGAAEHRVIAVLIDDAEPPGFLANRAWVDFRDATRRNESLNELVFGITGRREGHAGAASVADYRRRDAPTPVTTPSVDEVECLARMIARMQAAARPLRRTRLLAPIPGLAIFGAFWVYAQESPGTALATMLIVAPLITVLIAWSATATALAQCDRKLEQFEVLRDGLEACRNRTAPGCSRLRETFWNMMLRHTSELAGGRRAQT